MAREITDMANEGVANEQLDGPSFRKYRVRSEAMYLRDMVGYIDAAKHLREIADELDPGGSLSAQMVGYIDAAKHLREIVSAQMVGYIDAAKHLREIADELDPDGSVSAQLDKWKRLC